MNPIYIFMKRNYKKILLVLALSIVLFAFKGYYFDKKTNYNDKDKLLMELLILVIKQNHYDPATIDDTFSKSVYKSYLEAIDSSKKIFIQSDIDEFSKYETLLDDELLNKDLTFFNLTYFRLSERLAEQREAYREILEKPFDFSIDETFNTDTEKEPFAKTKEELYNRWKKQFKLSTLSMVLDKQKQEEETKSKDPKYSIKSFETLEKEARENTKKSLEESFVFMDEELTKDDWFNVLINSYMTTFDPHTEYYPAEQKEKFDESISGKLEGIGARLQRKNDYVEILELISGGPAWRSKEFEIGDRILKVAQEKGEPVDVVGMRLTEVVKKIKGPKGTKVTLTIKKVDGSIKQITITRDIVEIEETYVKSSLVEKNGLKYAVIYLPKFYIDFENKSGRNAGDDVAKEIERIKKENVQGIILDIRDDGGGSLSTVVKIAGLFIKEGPIVQVKTVGKQQDVLYDTDSKIEWDGPLVIMVNTLSASASEILAAAIQDYKRGVIVGSKQTYGKGTVQVVIPLNQYLRNSSLGDLGALKTTTQKFYRINGGSTQLKGVSSDVVMPDKYAYLEIGERDVESAMKWDDIKPAKYQTWKDLDNYKKLEKAIANSKKRVAENEQFKLIDQNAKWINYRKDQSVYSLKLEKFKKQEEDLEKTSKKFKAIGEYKNNLNFTSTQYEMNLFDKNTSLKDQREEWHKNLTKDVYVEEALNILEDLQSKNIPIVKK